MKQLTGTLKGLFTGLICIFALTQTGIVFAETSQSFGDFTVHYNAFNSDVLQPSMAEAYGIVRSKNYQKRSRLLW